MLRVSVHWLQEHAPELLRGLLRATAMAAENNEMREELRWYGDEANAIARNVMAKNTSAMMASMQVLALDGGKRAARFQAPAGDAPMRGALSPEALGQINGKDFGHGG